MAGKHSKPNDSSDKNQSLTESANSEQANLLPEDYEEYRKQAEERDEELFEEFQELFAWRRFLQTLRRLSGELVHGYLTGTRSFVSWITRIWIAIALIAGIVVWIWLVVNIKPSPGIPYLAYLIATGLIACFVFTFLVFLPSILLDGLRSFFRFLRDPYVWKVVAGVFIFLTPPTIILGIYAVLTKQFSLSDILYYVPACCICLIILAVIIGIALATIGTRMTRRAFPWLVLIGFPVGITLGVLLLALNLLLISLFFSSEPTKTKELAQNLFSKEVLALSAYFFAGVGFAITWICWSCLKTAIQPKIQRLLACLRTFASHLSKIQQFLINKLYINKSYVLAWKLLIFSAFVAIVSNLLPAQLRIFAIFLNVFIGLFTFAILLKVTLQYLFIPKELAVIRIEAPTYISRPVVRAAIVLALLFLAWWAFHAVCMLNLNACLQQTVHAVGFCFANGSVTVPHIGDFLFYAFALMTSASYVELQPVDGVAKLYSMFVTTTSLLLLVVFANAALSSSGETSSELVDSSNTDVS
jgi:hypothetical protein